MRNAILKELSPGHPWGESLHYYDTIDSTNVKARELAKSGAPHGTVLIAGHQTGGRGRMGRSFHSPEGVGVYFTVILRPECHATELMHLTCAAAVAGCNAVEAAVGLKPGIKWTNDLVWEKRKLGGILTELGLKRDGSVDYAIIGIGINCCQQEADFPEEIRAIAASLSMVKGTPVSRSRLSAALVEAFFRMDTELLIKKEDILNRYRANCVTLGKEISLVRSDGNVHHGVALDIDGEGALIVRHDDGRMEAVSSGEVSVRGMYGYL